MVSAKPPLARQVSHLNSSSDNVPSGWLCRLVSGASMKRFFIAGPWLRLSGANRSGVADDVADKGRVLQTAV